MVFRRVHTQKVCLMQKGDAMLVTKKQAIEDLKNLTSPDRVLTDDASLKFGEGYNLSYAKYFDLYPNPLPIAIVNAASTAEISAVLKYCNENDIYVQPRTGNSGGEWYPC